MKDVVTDAKIGQSSLGETTTRPSMVAKTKRCVKLLQVNIYSLYFCSIYDMDTTLNKIQCLEYNTKKC